jgi:hypothetical protein
MAKFFYYYKNAEMALINPLYPPSLGEFRSWGTSPDPRQEVSCTSYSALFINSEHIPNE